jgi:hypothetical protein
LQSDGSAKLDTLSLERSKACHGDFFVQNGRNGYAAYGGGDLCLAPYRVQGRASQ